jgi:hypothetical protein
MRWICCYAVIEVIDMTPQSFITKWGPGGPAYALNEEQGAQSHFIDLCDVLGVPRPGSEAGYKFEEKSALIGGRTGYADVFKQGAFAWENKAPGKNLDAALKQLLTYSLALSNPPILVVCDRLTIRIHTQFTGHPTETHHVELDELEQPEKVALLRRIWLDPESFRPKKTSRDITEAAAKSFATLADGLRKRGPNKDTQALAAQSHADDVAHFLTQCLFCFFAEDVGLLPGRMFEGLVNNRRLTSELLTEGLSKLFTAMRDGGMYGNDHIPWFNGGLFKTIKVPPLTVLDTTELRNAAALNWSAIDVSIFGTLFERGLDPSKRSQLGAHYTDPATIQRIIEPVLTRPLLQIWELLTPVLIGLLAKSRRKNDANYNAAHAKFIEWLDQLKNYRVLDPACGSGNFLFLGLKALKDIEHKSHLDAAAMGLDREADLVTGPHNMLGIELNEYAAELARVTVWIGELQWRLQHGYEFKTNPVLEPLDHIECRDALISFVADEVDSEARAGQTPAAHTLRFLKSPPVSAPPAPLSTMNRGSNLAAGKSESSGSNLGSDPSPQGAGSDPNLRAIEASWPWASIVIGNPPFLGDKKMRSELGDEYTEALRKVYAGRVPGGADLVTYWFEKARTAIEKNGLGAAGLVSTNSIRGGKNRFVLDAISKTIRIYEAWSDEGWVNEGAAVRVSLLAFGHASQTAVLDGSNVAKIYPDLTSSMEIGGQLDLSLAQRLSESCGVCFIGTQKGGPFEVAGSLARLWIKLPNVNGRSNAEVVRPWTNGQDMTRRNSGHWVIDFGNDLDEAEACEFEAPFAHALQIVKPLRAGNRESGADRYWWLHQRARPEMRAKLNGLARYIASPRVAKFRSFVWQHATTLTDSAAVAIAVADDTTFGILHSRFHELWSLRMCTWLGVGNDPRYTPTTCFETFPFPKGLTPADTAHQKTEVIASGALIPADISTSSTRTVAEKIATTAKRLNDLREAWLNPPEWTDRVPEVTPLGMTTSPYPDRILPKPGHEKDLVERTLTKLYNARPAWLDAAHKALDEAVAAAYGWADYTADMPDEEILKRLLALNLERSGAQP